MINFYFNMSPNPCKVALLLEECGLEYTPIPIDTRKGDQHSLDFREINPNRKVPVIVDDGVVVFDSGAILLYLAEKTNLFIPETTSNNRAELLSWMMFISTGIGPFTGQCIHFRRFAPEDNLYSLNRYDYEAWRHWNIIDSHLKNRKYMLGENYSIVDMALWGWCRAVTFALGENAWEQLPNVKRLFDGINNRSAASRVENLRRRFTFKVEMDDEARVAMFPQNLRLQQTVI